MFQTKVHSISETLHRRKYYTLYKQVEQLPVGSTLEITVDTNLNDAKRIRAALKGMAAYRKAFKITTEIANGDGVWIIKILKS